MEYLGVITTVMSLMCAWNVDQNGYALAANPTSIDAIDIYADGYVSNTSWGENFGTSLLHQEFLLK